MFLFIPQANWNRNGKIIFNKFGYIADGYERALKFIRDNKTSTGYNVLIFNNIKEAGNCKIALQNPLLRFTVYKLQDDQNVTYKKCYKYIPAIDWSDDKVRTDEGLLKVCGCSKDKAKEYADYCKKIIDEVDGKK